MNEKYLQTARLGEGVIYVAAGPSEVRGDREFHAGIIIKQSTETNVDLKVTFADGSEAIVRGVEFDDMAQRPGSWANRPKT